MDETPTTDERMVKVSYCWLDDFFTEGNEIHVRVLKGLPKGAMFVRVVDFNPYGMGVLGLVYRHPDWVTDRICDDIESVEVVFQREDK